MVKKGQKIFSREDWIILLIIAGLFIWFVMAHDVPAINKIAGLCLGLVVTP